MNNNAYVNVLSICLCSYFKLLVYVMLDTNLLISSQFNFHHDLLYNMQKHYYGFITKIILLFIIEIIIIEIIEIS